MAGYLSRRERERRRRENEIAAQGHASANASALSVQIGVRLDSVVADRLRASEHGLSDEIRQRLERTFKYDKVDPVTRELVEGLVNIAALLSVDFGAEWHAWPRAYEAFFSAVKQRIAAYAPPPGVMTGAGATMDILRDEPAETIGRMRERDDQRAHPYKHLADAHKRRSAGFTKHVKKGDTK